MVETVITVCSADSNSDASVSDDISVTIILMIQMTQAGLDIRRLTVDNRQ